MQFIQDGGKMYNTRLCTASHAKHLSMHEREFSSNQNKSLLINRKCSNEICRRPVFVVDFVGSAPQFSPDQSKIRNKKEVGHNHKQTNFIFVFTYQLIEFCWYEHIYQTMTIITDWIFRLEI